MQSVTLPRDCGLCGLRFASMNRERVTQVTLGFAIMSKETIAARINPGSKEGDPL